MKVLFLMISYPDVAHTTNMYTDLAQEFLIHAHEVFVAAPNNKSTSIGQECGVNVLRIKTLKLFNTSLIKKGFANLLLPYQFRRAIKKNYANIPFDLVIIPTPPITFIKTAKYLRKKHNSKIYLILRDIFPQNAVDLGLIKNEFVLKYFRAKEKELYKYSDSIGCMSKKNIEYVHRHNPEVNINKLHLLPNWSTISEEKSDSISNSFENVLINKFVLVFGGNFGIPQKIDFIIDIAEKIHYKKDILFVLIGEGTEKNRIIESVNKKQLSNVLILNQLPRDQYLSVLKNCDVGLVNLSEKFSIPNIPSRTLSYWASKIPVLAAVDKNTDYGELLEKSNGGIWSYTGDVDDYIKNILFLFNDSEMRKQMGIDGYNYLKNELNTIKTYSTIMFQIHKTKS